MNVWDSIPDIQDTDEFSGDRLNAETIAALEEGEEMIRNPAKYPRYETFQAVMDAVLRETEY